MRIIDVAKRAALSRLLLENTLSATPGEKLDEKLASLVLPDDYSECLCFISLDLREAHILPVPPPSTDDDAWWNRPGKHVATSAHML